MSALHQARKTGLFSRLQRGSEVSPQDLQAAAQLALQVEFTTIPAYLTALYSITDTGSYAYQALRSVAMEEMFHVNQAANLVVALGALPRFTGDYAPSYPTYLPQANPAATPYIGLYRASVDVFDEVFSAIETPAAPGAPAEGDNYDTIAQLYDAFLQAVAGYAGNPFQAEPPLGVQRTDIYLGKFGGTVLQVADKAGALKAVTQIVQQGEGTVPAERPLIPIEPFGAYNHYGQRTDGTYGPILGRPWEMSHFSKFRKVSLDVAAFPPTLPITSNPRIEEFGNPAARLQAEVFNLAYSVMLRAFEQTFTRAGGDPYFGVVLSLMHKVLPQLALSLMNTPAQLHGNADVGPNATPTWTWLSGARLADLLPSLEKALAVTDGATARAALAAAREGLNLLAADAAELDL